ncbi:hypothetical protein HDU81_002075 [Chytriomyces hyalinus]|nr:hypothetical protein HDU81_002075 [Chytriomyces hyalinus]
MAVKPRRSTRHSNKHSETIKSSVSSQEYHPESSDQDSDYSDDSDASLPESETSKLHDGLPHLKEPPSAYNIFLAEKSALLKIPIGEVVSMRHWSNLSAAEKEKYEAKARPAKEAYKQTLQSLGIKHMRRVRKAINQPKSPHNACTLFAIAKRTELAQAGESMRFNDICALWPKLSPAEKKRYIERATILKNDYNKEYQKFLDGGGTPMKRKKRDKQLPKLPASVFQIFQQHHKGIGLSVAQMTSMWKNLSKEEEMKYHQLYLKDHERYKREMEELGLSIQPRRGRYREHDSPAPESDSPGSASSSESSNCITTETHPIDTNIQTLQSSESESSSRRNTKRGHFDTAADEIDNEDSQNDGAEEVDGGSTDTRQSRYSTKRPSTAQAIQEVEPVAKRKSQRRFSKRAAKIRLEPVTANAATPKLMENVQTDKVEFDRLRQQNLFNETEAGGLEFVEGEVTASAMEKNASDDEARGPLKTAVKDQLKSSANGSSHTVPLESVETIETIKTAETAETVETIETFATVESESLSAIQRGIRLLSQGTPMARRRKSKSQITIKLPGSISKSKQDELDKIAVPNARWSRHSLQEAVRLLGRMRENMMLGGAL